MAALGIDIAGVEDVDLFLSYAEPTLAAAQAVARSLIHSAGKLWWAPDSGHDVRQHLHAFVDDPDRIAAAVQTQCELEERVESASVSATFFGGELRLTINLILTQDAARVQMTLTISALGEVLDASFTV